MTLYTVQISQWRVAKERGIEMVDTTVKSGLKFFAPKWEMVQRHKDGDLSDAEYTIRYLKMMEASETEVPHYWAEVASRGTIAIACYCQNGRFCHRYLLVEILRDYCKRHGIEFEYLGELKKTA